MIDQAWKGSRILLGDLNVSLMFFLKEGCICRKIAQDILGAAAKAPRPLRAGISKPGRKKVLESMGRISKLVLNCKHHGNFIHVDYLILT